MISVKSIIKEIEALQLKGGCCPSKFNWTDKADRIRLEWFLDRELSKLTEVYQTECYKCREQIEYTEIHSFCPNCLTSI